MVSKNNLCYFISVFLIVSAALFALPSSVLAEGGAPAQDAGQMAFIEFTADEEDCDTGSVELSAPSGPSAGTPEVLLSEDGVDFERLIQTALVSSREIKKIGINARNSENSLLLDEIAYRPNFTVKVDNDRNYNYSLSQKVADLVNLSVSRSDNSRLPDDAAVSYSLSLDMRRLDDSDLRLNRLSLNRDLLGYAHARETFKLRVERQFYELVQALEECKVLANSCARWREMLDYARSKYELGLANKIDYLNAEVNLANAQNALLQQEQNIQTLKEQFFDLIGYEPKDGSTAENSIKYRLEFAKMDTAEIAAITANADGSCVREDVEAERVALEIARVRHSKAKKNALPKLTLNVSKTDYENRARESNLESSLTWRFNLGRQENAVNEWIERNNLELRGIALDEIEKSARIDQREALRRIEYIEKAYDIAAGSLRQAYENYEFSTISFQKGLISNIDLRDAQDKLTSAKRSVVSLIIQHRLACRRFYFAMGKDL